MTGPRPKLLAIDDERLLVEGLKKVLEKRGFDVRFALSGKEGLEQVADDTPDVVLVDLRMPEMDGLEVLREIHRKHPQLPVIVMTAYATVQTAVSAVKEGAFDYIAKPFTNDQAEIVLRRALDHSRLVAENVHLRSQVRAKEAFKPLIGVSTAMKRLLVPCIRNCLQKTLPYDQLSKWQT